MNAVSAACAKMSKSKAIFVARGKFLDDSCQKLV